MINSPETPIKLSCGAESKNRFMLAPLTNQQSHEDGQLSDEELHWLTMRAKGGFGIVMTCASHVQEGGKGFWGQLGIFSDRLIPGHQKLTAAIKEHGSLSVIQLQHAGMRSPIEIINQAPLCPSDDEETGARALTLEEVKQVRDDFIAAALRAQKSGYDGVEIHGAHGYLITQFLSKEINKRTDEYGGSLENRSRLLFEIVNGIRENCGNNFLMGVRLSPERFGMDLGEIKIIAQKLIDENNIDFLDMSLWDCFKLPEDEKYKSMSLLEHFISLDRKNVLLTAAGNIRTGSDVTKALNAGLDFITIGRAGILHHDFPQRVIQDSKFKPVDTPVSKEHLRNEGLSEPFIKYLNRFPNFVIKDD
jgi:2,4-dienoyl-CoA reductase-like NADH-dependent reductase (Old Yellow Enzyme family)